MRRRDLVLLVAATGLVAALAAPNFARDRQCGGASWYAMAGNRTASGEPMNPADLTAAHRSLPFGTIVKVTNQANGVSLRVRINDRGPFTGGRIIDVSKAAAARLDFLRAGRAQVCIAIV
jgi:rare lipoprotein A